MKIAVVVFVYNRVDCAKSILDSLYQCYNFDEYDVYIYSDGAKSETDSYLVKNVRFVLHGFARNKKNIFICEQNTNIGLAHSIISGIDETFKSYDGVIVFEDDITISKNILNDMSGALIKYKHDNLIWSVSGYRPKNISVSENILIPRVCSACWATWRNRWGKNNWDVSSYMIFRDKNQQSEFCKGGTDMYKMLELQKLKRINSWAIRWDYNRFINNQYTLYPKFNMIDNSSGYNSQQATHNSGISGNKFLNTISKESEINFKSYILSDKAIKEFKEIYDLSFIGRVSYILTKYGLIKKVKKLYFNISDLFRGNARK